ncbi:MAG: hypothetical protein ACKPKO_23540 [Candidatus Fonsibacter sp.]
MIDDTPEYAQDRVNSPKGENKLHYEVVEHIKIIYKDVIISAILGENQLTNYMRMDTSKKGYTKGKPDLELKYKMTNGYIDVLALELKKH